MERMSIAFLLWFDIAYNFLFRYFCLFLVYLASGCAFTAISCAVPLWSDEGMRNEQMIVFVFVRVLF